MTPQAQIDQWKRDEAAVFEGWDFSYIKTRASQDEPPWSYRDRAAELIGHAHRLLDVDTGGGEHLRSLAPLPSGAKAIESYRPNVEVARDRLASLGVEVEEVAVGARWPFANGSFDLILNRHGHLNVPEIARTLLPGGVFLTQQVGGDNLADLIAVFGGSASSEDNTLAGMAPQFDGAGLVIGRGETWTGRQSFRDVGALVYFLKAIPWVIPGFGVDRHRAVLEQLQERVASQGQLTFSITRFLIEATNPARA